MLNIHLNGDIVRCPDIAEIKKRLYESREAHNICRYNFHESECQAWRSVQQTALNEANFNNKRNFCSNRCHLSGSDFCPGHIKQKELGRKEKKFKIDNQVYRKLASSAHYLVKESKTKTLFFTLTFPKFKRKVPYYEINQYFSRFVENLRKNYNCGGYIAVREFGKKDHRVHFHLLCAIPFIPFPVLNAVWCHCIEDICDFSKNAVQTDPKTRFITNPCRAMRYVCKYFSKCKNQNSITRLVFMSNNIIQKPLKYYDTLESILSDFKGIYINQTSDYTTCFRITNNKEFDRFCKNFIYPFFELSDKKMESLYAFPVDSS